MDDEEAVSRRQLFRSWGVGLRRGLTELVASRLPPELREDELLSWREEDLPLPNGDAAARLMRLLDIEGPSAGE
jgi:hypothetical protein